MKKITFVLITFLALHGNILVAQNSNLNLNDLPPTLEVKAPEFDTEKKYIFKIDLFQNNLVIQDLRKSKDGKVHFYQWIYEIPLNQLNSESIQISKDTYNNNEISITIKVDTSCSIMQYMFQDGKVSSIMTSGNLFLGNWAYSDSLYEGFVKRISTISASLPKQVSLSKKEYSLPQKFKYIAKNVTVFDANMDNDLSIGNGYYFEQIPEKLNSIIIKNIKSTLKQQNINYKYPLPVIVYTNREGLIESVFIGSQPYDTYTQIDLKKLNSERNDLFDTPIKYLLLVE